MPKGKHRVVIAWVLDTCMASPILQRMLWPMHRPPAGPMEWQHRLLAQLTWLHAPAGADTAGSQASEAA